MPWVLAAIFHSCSSCISEDGFENVPVLAFRAILAAQISLNQQQVEAQNQQFVDTNRKFIRPRTTEINHLNSSRNAVSLAPTWKDLSEVVATHLSDLNRYIRQAAADVLLSCCGRPELGLDNCLQPPFFYSGKRMRFVLFLGWRSLNRSENFRTYSWLYCFFGFK